MSPRSTLARAVVLSVLFLALSAPTFAQRPKPEIHGEFQGDPMYTVLPPDAIPAIHDPVYVTGEAAAAQMAPSETVMAIADENDAVCWSTWQLDGHEIVNDFKGETPIAVSW